jgi:hypothetical protein
MWRGPGLFINDNKSNQGKRSLPQRSQAISLSSSSLKVRFPLNASRNAVQSVYGVLLQNVTHCAGLCRPPDVFGLLVR